MSQLFKNVSNKIRNKIVKRKLQKSGDLTDNTKMLFDYFPSWISKFIINNIPYGGSSDYGSIRISMLNLPEIHNLINFQGKSIIELGPLEGGNSIILENFNIQSNISIEGRVESYLKCCMIKNIYDLNKTKFYLDDVMNISEEKYGTFEIAVVLGLLYHLDNPLKLLKKIGAMVDTVILSTHYADEASPYRNAKEIQITEDDRIYQGRMYIENPEIDPNAGLQNYSFWPYEKDLFNMCNDSGFKKINVIKKNVNPKEKYKLIYLIASKI